LITNGFGEQVVVGGVSPCGGNPAARQVTFTVLINPPLGVTVIVDIWLAPAVTVTALPPIVNEPLGVTVTVTAVDGPDPL
jgi:hypothetical protein